MEYAVVICALLATFLVNKWLNQREKLEASKHAINKEAIELALSAAVDELSKKFDSRINKAFEHHSLIKTELDALKLQIGLKGLRQNGQ